ncbi:hypothetical protein R4Z09_04180 [Niallia oryzisoli]|uniref:Uncharacterized protein n=1 Tax=Niallia oryzisoli TaxID=1737571 RepID=A0ABZ2CJQ1_9BACI
MSWERKALERVLELLVEKDKDFKELTDHLYDLGIVINKNSSAYEILRDIMAWESMPINLSSVQAQNKSKEIFVKDALKYIEEKFNK